MRDTKWLLLRADVWVEAARLAALVGLVALVGLALAAS